MRKRQRPRKWQNIIWREWRNCEDREYASHLFDLVADKPVGWGSSATMVLFGLLYGAMAGLLVGLIASNWDVWNKLKEWTLTYEILQEFVWKGCAIGGAGGLLIRLLCGRQLSWKAWLTWLTPHISPSALLVAWTGELGLSLVSGIIGGLVGGLFFGLVRVLGGGLVDGPTNELIYGLGGGLGFGFVSWLIVWWVGRWGDASITVFWILGGLVSGLVAGLVSNLHIGLASGIGLGLSSGLYYSLFGFSVFRLISALVSGFIGGVSFGVIFSLLGGITYGQITDGQDFFSWAVWPFVIGALIGGLCSELAGFSRKSDVYDGRTAGAIGGGIGLMLIPIVALVQQGISVSLGSLVGLAIGSVTLAIMVAFPLGMISGPLGEGIGALISLLVFRISGLPRLPRIQYHEGLLVFRISDLRSRDYYEDYRIWWFWWYSRPRSSELEAAIYAVSNLSPITQKDWIDPLCQLEEGKAQPGTTAILIDHLRSQDWTSRFSARHSLISLGGEAVKPLLMLAQQEDKILGSTALWILQNVAQDTTFRLKKNALRLLCPQCLLRYGAHTIDVLGRVSFTYYGCRACGQSLKFLSVEVVAELNLRMVEKHLQEDDVLRVNWLGHRSLFDFDRVEIVCTTEYEIERLCIQVGNDIDKFRRPRYRKMCCTVALQCNLPQSSLNMLRAAFGRVDITEIQAG